MNTTRRTVNFEGDTSREARLLQFAALRRLTISKRSMSRRSTFNAIHDQTSFKIDFFIKGTAPFDQGELLRSVRQLIGDTPGHSVALKSAEDTILRKFEWFRPGGDVSERQFQDAVSVLAAARGQLEEGYLDRWAQELGITDLLARARQEASDL